MGGILNAYRYFGLFQKSLKSKNTEVSYINEKINMLSTTCKNEKPFIAGYL